MRDVGAQKEDNQTWKRRRCSRELVHEEELRDAAEMPVRTSADDAILVTGQGPELDPQISQGRRRDGDQDRLAARSRSPAREGRSDCVLSAQEAVWHGEDAPQRARRSSIRKSPARARRSGVPSSVKGEHADATLILPGVTRDECKRVKTEVNEEVDASSLTNSHMSEADVERALAQAVSWIENADAILLGSGAGFGVDSGLATFRNSKVGVWRGMEKVGLSYEEICDPKWFVQDPALAWAFWNHCHCSYGEAAPHEGYDLVRQWSNKVPLGAFSFTSNIDSHWLESGWDEGRLVEVHGAVRWLQCSQACTDDVWRAGDLGLCEEQFRAKGELPRCPRCGAIARPNVMMFGEDPAFSKVRRAQQTSKYESWIRSLQERSQREYVRLICIEIGCGLAVRTVRKELYEVMSRFPGARLIRVNPDQPWLEPEVQDRAVSIPLGARCALQSISQRASVREMSTLVIRDHANTTIKVCAPMRAAVLHVLHLLERAGTEIVYGALQEPRDPANEPFAVFYSQWDLPEVSSLASPVPRRFFFDLNPDAEGERMTTACFQVVNVWFSSETCSSVVAGINWCTNLLRDMIQEFSTPTYQEEVRRKRDRKNVTAMVEVVKDKVLPCYGLEANNTGMVVMQMKIWMYGLCDKQIFQLAEESLRLSYIRMSGRLPWIAKEAKNGVLLAQRLREKRRMLARHLRLGEQQRVEKERTEVRTVCAADWAGHTQGSPSARSSTAAAQGASVAVATESTELSSPPASPSLKPRPLDPVAEGNEDDADAGAGAEPFRPARPSRKPRCPPRRSPPVTGLESPIVPKGAAAMFPKLVRSRSPAHLSTFEGETLDSLTVLELGKDFEGEGARAVPSVGSPDEGASISGDDGDTADLPPSEPRRSVRIAAARERKAAQADTAIAAQTIVVDCETTVQTTSEVSVRRVSRAAKPQR